MDRSQEIESRLSELQDELKVVEGTKTEIYTRIVGYYRSLKNWNLGKREEYDHRVTFRSESSGTPGEHMPAKMIVEQSATGAAAAVAAVQTPAEAFAAAAVAAASLAPPTKTGTQTTQSGISSYAYFFREKCPNCPPVRTYVENLGLDGQMVDVDTGEGMAQAIEHQILSTPTVILMDQYGAQVAQAGSVDQLRSILESVG